MVFTLRALDVDHNPVGIPIEASSLAEAKKMYQSGKYVIWTPTTEAVPQENLQVPEEQKKSHLQLAMDELEEELKTSVPPEVERLKEIEMELDQEFPGSRRQKWHGL